MAGEEIEVILDWLIKPKKTKRKKWKFYLPPSAKYQILVIVPESF